MVPSKGKHFVDIYTRTHSNLNPFFTWIWIHCLLVLLEL